jgi:hypothetical protein
VAAVLLVPHHFRIPLFLSRFQATSRWPGNVLLNIRLLQKQFRHRNRINRQSGSDDYSIRIFLANELNLPQDIPSRQPTSLASAHR